MNSDNSDYENDILGLPIPQINNDENIEEEIDFPLPTNNLPIVNNTDYSNFQDNYNQFYQMLNEEKSFFFKALPIIFYHGYDEISYLENSNKMIIPKSVLYDISKYENIKYPMRFKINDSDILFSVYEFREDVANIFISQDMITNFGIEIDVECKLTLFNEEIETGTKIVLKPHTSNFLEIEDHKSVLETHLVKAYDTLIEGQTISIPYFDQKIFIDIIKCEPNKMISILETDLEVDFEQPYDYVEPPPNPPTPEFVPVSINNPNLNIPQVEEEKGFVPFSGKGHRLGGN
jgi:hypothetical protein